MALKFEIKQHPKLMQLRKPRKSQCPRKFTTKNSEIKLERERERDTWWREQSRVERRGLLLKALRQRWFISEGVKIPIFVRNSCEDFGFGV